MNSVNSETGLAALFSAEQAAMVRMATLMVGSAAVAEEVVQDGFAQVGERWADISNPGGYLRTTIVNGCRSVLRHRKVEDRYRPSLVGPLTGEFPAQLVELRDALDRLDERQRIVVVLRYFVDIPDDDIAVIIDVQPDTVRSIAHRALVVLRKELT